MAALKPTHPWLAHYPPNIAWDAPIPVKPVFALMDEAEKRFFDQNCTDFMGKTMSFGEIAAKIRSFAASLQRMGVKKGVKVGIFMPNCPQFIISYYGILRAGGTVVNFNPLYSDREVKRQVEDAGCRIMVTVALTSIHQKLLPLLDTTPLRQIIVADLQDAMPKAKALAFEALKRSEIAHIPNDGAHISFQSMLEPYLEPYAVNINPREDIAVLQYTGGTTGVPKGTMLTHANLYANTVQCGLWFTGLTPGEERMLGVLPLFHVFAMTVVMNLGIHTGAKIILHPRFDVKAVLADIEDKKPTLMPGVPTLFAAINNVRGIEKHDLSSIKMCISGGAPLPMEVKQKFESLTGCKLVEGYGLSETSPVTHANPLFGVNKAGSIGLPLPGTITEIVNKDDKTTLLPAGEIGEVCIRGPQVMKGYYNKPEETALVLKDGRLHTGDLGKMDEDGYFYIVDRLKEMYISGGFNVYPRNVEEALYMHPDVVEAAVIGITEAKRGQVGKAFVVKKEGSTLDEITLRAYLRTQLAPYEVPAKVEFMGSLPKTLIGKIDKKQLV